MNPNIDIMDTILDNLIAEAVPIAAKNVADKMPEPEEHIFSEEYERKMAKLFAKERGKAQYKKVQKYLLRSAAAFLILVTAAAMTIYGVDAWRISFMNFIVDLRTDHTVIDFRKDFAGDTFETDELSLRFIPYGFMLESSFVSGNQLVVYFINEDLSFRVIVRDVDATMAIDTEDANVRRLQINGFQAFLRTNENNNILVWHDNINSFEMSGNICEDDMTRIARKIEVNI